MKKYKPSKELIKGKYEYETIKERNKLYGTYFRYGGRKVLKMSFETFVVLYLGFMDYKSRSK